SDPSSRGSPSAVESKYCGKDQEVLARSQTDDTGTHHPASEKSALRPVGPVVAMFESKNSVGRLVGQLIFDRTRKRHHGLSGQSPAAGAVPGNFRSKRDRPTRP